MLDMNVEERLQLLSAEGKYEELCTVARDYLAHSGEKQHPDTVYTARILLGQTLLGLSAEYEAPDLYTEGAHLLMRAYNDRGNEGLYNLLYTVSCAPNEAGMRANYDFNRQAATLAEHRDLLPPYEQLPIVLFPLTDTHSVLFDKEQKLFLLNERESGQQELYHELLLTEASVVCEERLSRAVYEAERHLLQECLIGAIQMHDFGTDMQTCAEKYRALCPYGELYEIFRAEEALGRQDMDAALHYGEAAYEKRKMSAAVHDLLYRIYTQSGQTAYALLFLILGKGSAAAIFPNDVRDREKHLDIIRVALTNMQFAPFITEPYVSADEVKTRLCVKLAEELPRFVADMPSYWTNIYNPYGLMYIKGEVLALMNSATDIHGFPIYNDFLFDIMKAHESSSYQEDQAADAPVLLPVAAKQSHQMIRFHRARSEHTRMFSMGEFNFYRIEEPVKLTSEQSFLVGEPIVLRHAPQRRKLVLNILADGLSWKGIRDRAPELIPNALKFFSKGVVFDHYFSTAEYTYPALATIETGLYQHHTQIAKPGVPFSIDTSYVTVSEQMKKLGYYCTNIQGDAQGIYNGATRGFDRLIVNHWMLRAMDGVERFIRHLQTFDECDNFLFMHFADTHPFNADVSTPAYAAAHLGLADVLQPQDRESSVFLKANRLSQYVNYSEVQAVDRHLGMLFDYLTAHYGDDEYIVMLYSDHGASVHARSPYLLSEEQTGAALMARGAGVPALGRVDELTSSVDIYKILGKLAGYPIDADYLDGNLPEAFGGQRREYTVSNSIYPGQTYKICVRTERHAFHLETAEFTREDGTISLDRYTYHIHERNESYREVFDDALVRYFLDIVWQYTESFRR